MSEQQTWVLPGIGTQRVILPEGGDFVPSGFVGPFMAAMLYQVTSNIDTDLCPDLGVKYLHRREQSNGWRYYFPDYDQADKVRHEDHSRYGPTTTWVYEVNIDQIVNWGSDEVKDKFKTNSDDGWMRNDVIVQTMGSKKNRHEFHMLALPTSVAAVAKVFGFEVPEYDVGDFVSISSEYGRLLQEGGDVTGRLDELFSQYFGNPDSRDKADDDHYTKSIMWGQRRALWAALGEEDPEKYKETGSTTPSGKPSRYATESPKLTACLQLAERVWTSPQWARVHLIPNPRTDAVYTSKSSGETRRLQLPILTELFRDEAHARSVAVEEGSGSSSTTPSSGPVEPDLPAMWKQIGAPKLMDEIKGRVDSPAVIVAQQLGMEESAYQEWVQYMRDTGKL